MAACNISNYAQLNIIFDLIIFDWDGTAVANRKADAQRITQLFEKLIALGVKLCVVTGTNFENIDKQCTSNIDSEFKSNLYICTNRGSEVYGFDKNSQPEVLYSYNATETENFLLNKVAESVKNNIQSASSLDVNIVYNRMNRRKIDIYTDWADPPKSEIDILLLRVEQKLKDCGYTGTLKDIFELAVKYSSDFGLKDARITSDVKHIEVGLTDKSDSMKWILDNVANKYKISDDRILVLGDEFGSIGGFNGSDYLMYLPVHPLITYASVGIEPNGVPSGIINIGGGPECFGYILESQIQKRLRFPKFL